MVQSYWTLTDPLPASFFLKKPRMAPLSCPWKRKRCRIAHRVVGWSHVNQQPISSIFLAGFRKYVPGMYIETALKSSLKTTWSVLVLLCCWLCRWCWNGRFLIENAEQTLQMTHCSKMLQTNYQGKLPQTGTIPPSFFSISASRHRHGEMALALTFEMIHWLDGRSYDMEMMMAQYGSYGDFHKSGYPLKWLVFNGNSSINGCFRKPAYIMSF